MAASHTPLKWVLMSEKKVWAVSRLSLPAWCMGPMRSMCSASASELRPPCMPSTAVIIY